MPSNSQILNTASWITFLVGVLIVIVAWLTVTFGKNKETFAALGSRELNLAMTIGTGLMYLALLMLPAVHLMHFHEQGTLNDYDWGSAVSQWIGYILLPVALYLWDSPSTATTGAVTLGVSVLALVASAIFASAAARKRRTKYGALVVRDL